MNDKELGASNKKCTNCGGDLVFNPKTRKIDCEKCGSEFDFVMKRVPGKHDYTPNIPNQDTLAWARQKKIMKCDTCGADIELFGLEFTKKCPYCESSYVCDIKELPGLKPDGVMPFSFDKTDAIDKFKEGIRKKFFVPLNFKRNLAENSVLGVYEPTFNFDMRTISKYSGVLEKDKYVGSGKNRRVVHEHFNIKGTKDLTHTDYVVEASDNLNDKQITSVLPYHLGEDDYAYDPNFVRGHVAKHYEDDLDTCHKVCIEKIDEAIKKHILDDYNYDRVVSLDINTNYLNQKYIYRLLPVYNFVFHYKKKNYTVVMNGQTGKVGKGCPVSPFKVALCVLLGLAAVAFFLYLAYIDQEEIIKLIF